MHTITNAIAILNKRKTQAAYLAAAISSFFDKRDISCRVFEYDGNEVKSNPFEAHDFAITLGGDGTVLFAARYCAGAGIPVFPVNLGEFGFIAGIKPSQWQSALESYLDGSFHSTRRMLLQAEVLRNGSAVYTACALNDLSILSGHGTKIINFDVSFKDENRVHCLGLFKADGVIAATPTGSTGYSAAAGGPILSPDVPAVILSPVCAFSLSSRPIVLPSSGQIIIDFAGTQNKDGGVLSVDGQESFDLQIGDKIIIEMAKKPVKLIGCAPEVFYSALRYKLNWAGAPVARLTDNGKDAQNAIEQL